MNEKRAEQLWSARKGFLYQTSWTDLCSMFKFAVAPNQQKPGMLYFRDSYTVNKLKLVFNTLSLACPSYASRLMFP